MFLNFTPIGDSPTIKLSKLLMVSLTHNCLCPRVNFGGILTSAHVLGHLGFDSCSTRFDLFHALDFSPCGMLINKSLGR